MKKLFLLLVCFISLFACSKDTNNPLIGFWSRTYTVPVCNVRTYESYEFRADGQCVHMRQSDRVDPGYSGSTHPINESLRYSIIDEHTLSLGSKTIKYTLSSDKRSLSLDGHTYKGN